MIERLNFYDLYGYLIPGALLIGVIWLPFALAFGWLPPSDFGSAIISLIAAYVAGHILQAVATRVVPSTVGGRYPSAIILDDTDRSFNATFKTKLTEQVQKDFGLDLKSDVSRGVAVLQCRAALIATGRAAYVEQFQGMYVLMRGIAASAAIGCVFTVGWLWSPFFGPRATDVAAWIIIICAGVLAVVWRDKPPTKERASLVFSAIVLVAVVAGGALAGGHGYHAQQLLSSAAIIELLAAIWSFGAYRGFGERFAKTVYQDYMTLQKYPKKAGD